MQHVLRPLYAVVLIAGAIAALVFTSHESVSAKSPTKSAETLSELFPISHLTEEADDLMAKLAKDIASEASYKMKKKLVVQNAYTLAIVAHGVSEHEKNADVSWKTHALGLRDAARQLADAENFSDAKQALDKVSSLHKGEGAAPETVSLKWEEVADLTALMASVNRRNLLVRRGIRRPRPGTARHTTIISLLTYAARSDHSAVKDAGTAESWESLCDTLIKDYSALRSLIEAGKKADANKAMRNAVKSCSNCHKIFRPDVE